MMRSTTIALSWTACLGFTPSLQPQNQRTFKTLLPATDTGRRVRASPGSELFPKKGSSYVPLGLTQEEYGKIKADEKAELARKNFAMFGPRFAPVDVPEGDWFLTPKLWTLGYQSGDFGPVNGEDSQLAPLNRLRQRALLFVRQNALPYLMCYLLLDMLAAGVLVSKTAERTLRSSATTLVRLMVWRQRAAAQSLAMSLLTWSKLELVKVALASVLTVPAKRFIDRVNRSRLWSPRRTVLTSLGSGLGILTLWTVLLVVFKSA